MSSIMGRTGEECRYQSLAEIYPNPFWFGPLWGDEQRPASPASPASPWHGCGTRRVRDLGTERCKCWPCRDVERRMCLFFGIHAYACIRDILIPCSKSTNRSIRSPWVLLRLLESSDKNQIFCSDTVLNSSLLQLHSFNCIRNWGFKKISEGKRRLQEQNMNEDDVLHWWFQT